MDRTRDRHPVADLMRPVAQRVQKRVRMAAGLREVRSGERRQEGSIEFWVVALHPWRTDGVGEAASGENAHTASQSRPP